MNIAKSLFIFTALAGLATATSHAQSWTDTVTIDGRLTGLSNSFQGEQTLDSEATFKAIIELDRNGSFYFENSTVRQFDDAVISVSVELRDAQGMLIETPVPTNCDETTFVTDTNSNAYLYFTDGAATSGTYGIEGGDMNGRYLGCSPRLAELVADLFPENVYFPIPNAGDYESSFAMTVMNGEPGRGIMMDISGVAESITVETIDSDGDGVGDFSDACVSVNSETVVFEGWHDSGVTNHTDAQGCTIMDAYAACTMEEEEAPRFTRRSFSFYSGPSYCEKQVAYGLVSDGMIDFGEARALRDALYFAHRNQPET